MERYKYVIIGGGLASATAADGIRQVDEGGSVALVTGENHVPYERPPLSKAYLRGEVGLEFVYLNDDAAYAGLDIDLLKGERAVKVAPDSRSVTLEDGRLLGYERLLLATGGHARRLPIPGGDLHGVFTLRTIEDSDGIRNAAQSGGAALVLGGSFIGSEVAASLSELGMDVTMAFPEGRLLERIVPRELSDFLHAKYEREGVRILSGTKPQEFEGEEKVEGAKLDSGEVLDLDLVVMGVGIQLNTELALDAGLAMGHVEEIIVDEYLRTSDPYIFAAGDIAAWPDATFGKRLRVEHWDVAQRQGLRAGLNMAGEEEPYTVLPYFYSELFDVNLEVWGNLTGWNQTVLRGRLEEGSFAFYYFDEGRMVGVLACRRPNEERGPMEALVSARPLYEDLAARLPDEGVDLSSLVG